MKHNILIVGGNGLVGKTIIRILKLRNPHLNIFTGGRKGGQSDRDLKIDVTHPGSFAIIKENKIDLIILSVNDKEDHMLRFAIENKIDYLDITKPTPDLVKAYSIAKNRNIDSRVVFSSGWMGGIVNGLVKTLSDKTADIQEVKLFVYYSVKDLAGESSAHFMAENVDLYILNQIEKIPNVSVKMTYNSKFITWLLGAFQKVRIFNILSLKERRMIFGSSGKGDQAVFEIVVRSNGKVKKLSLQSMKGQAELTALSAVLHTEELLKNVHENSIYFSHQLHQPSLLLEKLKSYETINIQSLS
jgi:hypothetical protein